MAKPPAVVVTLPVFVKVVPPAVEAAVAVSVPELPNVPTLTANGPESTIPPEFVVEPADCVKLPAPNVPELVTAPELAKPAATVTVPLLPKVVLFATEPATNVPGAVFVKDVPPSVAAPATVIPPVFVVVPAVCV